MKVSFWILFFQGELILDLRWRLNRIFFCLNFWIFRLHHRKIFSALSLGQPFAVSLALAFVVSCHSSTPTVKPDDFEFLGFANFIHFDAGISEELELASQPTQHNAMTPFSIRFQFFFFEFPPDFFAIFKMYLIACLYVLTLFNILSDRGGSWVLFAFAFLGGIWKLDVIDRVFQGRNGMSSLYLRLRGIQMTHFYNVSFLASVMNWCRGHARHVVFPDCWFEFLWMYSLCIIPEAVGSFSVFRRFLFQLEFIVPGDQRVSYCLNRVRVMSCQQFVWNTCY